MTFGLIVAQKYVPGIFENDENNYREKNNFNNMK